MTKQKPAPPYKSPGDDEAVLTTAAAMMDMLHNTGRPPTLDAATYATKRLAAAMFVTFAFVLDKELEDEPGEAETVANELRALAFFLDPATRDVIRDALDRLNAQRLWLLEQINTPPPTA